MKTTELFVEQTLTGFLILAAGAAPFLSWEKLEKLPGEAKGGIDISSAAGAIGIAYLLGVIFDRFADTLLERINRWNRLLFAIELKKENKALSPDDAFPEDRLQIGSNSPPPVARVFRQVAALRETTPAAGPARTDARGHPRGLVLQLLFRIASGVVVVRLVPHVPARTRSSFANAPPTPCTRFQPRVLVRVGQRRRAGTLHPARVVSPRSRRMRRAQTRQRVPA
jgi:hypothetical protein